MATTRRDALAAALSESGADFPEPDSGATEANGSSAEAGFPFELLSGPRLTDDIPPPVKTRVKSPEEKEKIKSKTPSRGTASERQLADIGESIEEKIVQTALLLQGLVPVTSIYAAENSPKAVNALLSIAKRRPKVLLYLTKVADGVDVLELAKFVGGLAVAFQVDMGRMNGDEKPARAFGVTQILDEFFSDRESGNENPAMEFQVPRFVSV